MRRSARGRLRYPCIADVVDKSCACRDDADRVVPASFDLCTPFPLMVGPEETALIVADGRLDRRAADRQRADLRWCATRDIRPAVEAARGRPVPYAGRVVLVKEEAAHTNVPHGIGGQGVSEVAEGDGRHVRVGAVRGLERHHDGRRHRVDPDLFVEALLQLQAGRQPPIQLREDLVLLVGSWKGRIGARLAVVVAQMLVSREEPQPIAHRGTTDVRGQVLVFDAFVAARQAAGAWNDELFWLAREPGRLAVVRRVGEKPVAPLPCHDVDHGALHVAVFGRSPDRLDLHFLDEVDPRFGSRLAAARAGEICPIEQKLVFVRAGTERGDSKDASARRRRRRDARSGPDRIEHARSPHRNRRQGLGAEAGAESAVPCLQPGAGAFDYERKAVSRRLQRKRSLDGGAYRDPDVIFVRGCEPLKRDLQHVRAWRESREAKLPAVVGGLHRRSTHQRRGADAHGRTLKDATINVLDGTDECARQALRPPGRRNQDESRGSQQEPSPSLSSRRGAVSGEPHVTLPSRLEQATGEGSNPRCVSAREVPCPTSRKRERGPKT